MTKPQKHYDAQFKRDAVELLLTSGRPLKRLAHELGVCDVTLRSWRDRHLATALCAPFEGVSALSVRAVTCPTRSTAKNPNAICYTFCDSIGD